MYAGIEDLRAKRSDIDKQLQKELDEKVIWNEKYHTPSCAFTSGCVTRGSRKSFSWDLVLTHVSPTSCASRDRDLSDVQNQIQNDLVALQKRLTQVNAAIQRKEASREEYDKTIVETQAAYMKVRQARCTLRTHICIGARGCARLACAPEPDSDRVNVYVRVWNPT